MATNTFCLNIFWNPATSNKRWQKYRKWPSIDATFHIFIVLSSMLVNTLLLYQQILSQIDFVAVSNWSIFVFNEKSFWVTGNICKTGKPHKEKRKSSKKNTFIVDYYYSYYGTLCDFFDNNRKKI